MRTAMHPTVELVVTLLFFNHASNVAVGKFDFTVHLEVYQNPNNWRHTGTCCDDDSVNGTCKKCDTKIFFCLRRYGASLLTIYDRTLSTSNCHLALFETSLESLPRDVRIISSSPWPNDGLLQLYMRIVDVDGSEFILTIGNLRITGDIDPDDVIDEYTHLIALRPGLSLPIQSFTGVYVIATWRAGFSVECSRGYFGSECEGVCSLPDHGNFVCLDNDTFTCEEGWRGQSCNDCIPTAGCSRTGGYCNTPGECICREGYNGTHCEYPMCRQGCHSVGGFCSTPGECVCRNGWSGERCDQCIPASGCSTTGGYCLHPGECRCRIGFVGDTCSTPISVLPPCTANNTLCQNGGTCINVGTSHSICVCPPSHSGLYCEEEGSTGAGTEQLDRSSEGNGSTWVRPLVDVVIALTVVAGAVIITVIVAKVFLRRRAAQGPNDDGIRVIPNDLAARQENEDRQAQGGREQVQVAEQGPNHDLLIMIEDNQVEPPIQVGAVAPQLPPNQPPHGVVHPLPRGNNEIEQPPANDPRIPNRVS